LSFKIKMTRAILIHEEYGHIEEIELDIAPEKNEIYKLLGGKATFIGQWCDLDVVIMKAIHGLVPNENTLPSPFDNEIIMGAVLLVRMDENSDPQDFTLDEYHALRNRHMCLPI